MKWLITMYDLNYLRFSLASEVFHTSLVSVNACNIFRFEIVSGKKDAAYNYKINNYERSGTFTSKLTT